MEVSAFGLEFVIVVTILRVPTARWKSNNPAWTVRPHPAIPGFSAVISEYLDIIARLIIISFQVYENIEKILESNIYLKDIASFFR